MLKLRPHHFFCMKAFIGKGYSKEFTKNMTETIKRLKGNPNQDIEIILGLDNLCRKCPHNIDDSICATNEKVLEMDNKVKDYFKIKEGIYNYKYIKDYIYDNINEDIVKDVCSGCSWYGLTNCKELILS